MIEQVKAFTVLVSKIKKKKIRKLSKSLYEILFKNLSNFKRKSLKNSLDILKLKVNDDWTSQRHFKVQLSSILSYHNTAIEIIPIEQ